MCIDWSSSATILTHLQDKRTHLEFGLAPPLSLPKRVQIMHMMQMQHAFTFVNALEFRFIIINKY